MRCVFFFFFFSSSSLNGTCRVQSWKWLGDGLMVVAVCWLPFHSMRQPASSNYEVVRCFVYVYLLLPLDFNSSVRHQLNRKIFKRNWQNSSMYDACTLYNVVCPLCPLQSCRQSRHARVARRTQWKRTTWCVNCSKYCLKPHGPRAQRVADERTAQKMWLKWDKWNLKRLKRLTHRLSRTHSGHWWESYIFYFSLSRPVNLFLPFFSLFFFFCVLTRRLRCCLFWLRLLHLVCGF